MIFTNLLSNMIVLTFSGAIPTNTPALDEYAFKVIFTNAQTLAYRWHLDKNPMASDRVTHFRATPYPEGIDGGIVFDGRYSFGTFRGFPLQFRDNAYYKDSVFSITARTTMMTENEEDNAKGYENWRREVEVDLERHRGVVEQWRANTNAMPLKEAQKIAESAMKAYGVQMRQMSFRSPNIREQLRWSEGRRAYESNGWIIAETDKPLPYLPLPYYVFGWKTVQEHCTVHVSGITSNVVFFDFARETTNPLNPDRLELKRPPNYLELLGLPSDTIFVKRRLGMPPTYESVSPKAITPEATQKRQSR
jgi:hypothetical protein